MKRLFPLLLHVVLLLAAAGNGRSADALSIRLVEASRESAPPVAALADVADILSRNLPFASYSLQGSQSLALPARQTVSLGGFTLTCTGPAEELQLAVRRGNRTLISTLLRLQRGTPVIVGGFPSARGRQIFVIVAR